MCEYALTITLKPTFRIVKGVNQHAPWQYDMSHEKLCDLLHACNITLYTAIAELTKAGDIHYHVFLLSDDDLRGLQYNIACYIKDQTIFGMFVLKEVKDKQGWVEYILKDCAYTHKLISRPAVIRDDLELVKDQPFSTPL